MDVSSTDFSVHMEKTNRLASVGLEPAVERAEDAGVVCHTVGVRARVVRVEVLVHVEDELADTASRVGDLEQVRAGLSRERRRARVRRAGDEDDVRGRAGGTDGVHRRLDRVRPRLEARDVVRLVHDTEDDCRLVSGHFSEERLDAPLELPLNLAASWLQIDAY
jgi:hypothetical protein